jgi:hypothetical protein
MEAVMRQIFLITILCLVSGLAAGDFELKDPAQGYEEKTIVVDEVGDYAVEGAGLKSCDNYQSDRRKNGSMHYINLNWVKGFITGVNYIRAESQESAQLGTALDLDALTLWMNNYCSKNPRATLSDASAALVNELMN